MKRAMTFALSLALLSPAAFAQTTVQNGNVAIQPGATVRELPGNAYIVGGNGGGSGVTITGDESALYHALVGQYRNRYNYNRVSPVPNTAPAFSVDQICGNETSISRKNSCIKDVLRQQERLQKKYNN